MIFAVILIAAGVIALILFALSGNICGRLMHKLDTLTDGCTVYEAVVLDVHKGRKATKEIIVQFRITEQKRTVVNRCREKFFGNYSRGDKVMLYFREEMPMDFSMLRDDNICEKKMKLCMNLKIPFAVTGAVMTAAGIIMAVI
ncbi:MAG: hypothetical protein ACI4Q6_04830 [Huintestinicola sp.]